MHGAADEFQIAEYSRDRWNMERVPRALLACMVGLFFVVYVDPRPAGGGILRAFVVLVVVFVIGLLAHFLLEQLFEGTTAIKFAAGAVIVIALVALFWNSPGDFFRSRRTSGIQGAVLGWILIMGGLGWIAFALYRHFNPARPILTLSPEGISYDTPGLNLVVPWHEVQAVAAAGEDDAMAPAASEDEASLHQPRDDHHPLGVGEDRGRDALQGDGGKVRQDIVCGPESLGRRRGQGVRGSRNTNQDCQSEGEGTTHWDTSLFRGMSPLYR